MAVELVANNPLLVEANANIFLQIFLVEAASKNSRIITKYPTRSGSMRHVGNGVAMILKRVNMHTKTYQTINHCRILNGALPLLRSTMN